jgi:hypothetical protein
MLLNNLCNKNVIQLIESAFREIIENFTREDFELFMVLHSQQPLFDNSLKVFLNSISEKAYEMFQIKSNLKEVLMSFE